MGVGSLDDAALFGLAIARAAAGSGLRVRGLAVTTHRDDPDAEVLRALARTTGRAVLRVDPGVMPPGDVGRASARAARGSDLVLAVVAAPLDGSSGVDPLAALAALRAPVALWYDASLRRSGDLAFVDAARRVVLEGLGVPLLALPSGPSAAQPGARWSSIHGESAPLVEASEPLGRTALRRLLRHARRAGALPPIEPTATLPRARIGVLLDDCFDLYDEEGLVALEEAGADLVPISPLEGAALPELDGLLAGDARIERDSAELSARRAFRDGLRDRIADGLPTVALAGGFAYLTRGFRSACGALHPMVGAIDANAHAVDRPLPAGPVEVETTVDTLVGAAGTRLRGRVERAWVVRGVPDDEREIYATLEGPADGGCGRQQLFAAHFRPYWPASPGAAQAFVDRCARRAAALVQDRRTQGRRELAGT